MLQQIKKIIVCVFITQLSSISLGHSREVDFEKVVRLIGSYELNDTKLTFTPAVEWIGSGESSSDNYKSYRFMTQHDHYCVQNNQFFWNGRRVLNHSKGDDYLMNKGCLTKINGEKIQLVDSYEEYNIKGVDTDKRVLKSFEYKISVLNYTGPGFSGVSHNATYARFNISYVCLKIWDGEVFIWGQSYGKITDFVEIDLKRQIVNIDDKEVKIVKPLLSPKAPQ
jgi:hypothetical protein